jgi:hypothetical protein
MSDSAVWQFFSFFSVLSYSLALERYVIGFPKKNLTKTNSDIEDRFCMENSIENY